MEEANNVHHPKLTGAGYNMKLIVKYNRQYNSQKLKPDRHCVVCRDLSSDSGLLQMLIMQKVS